MTADGSSLSTLDRERIRCRSCNPYSWLVIGRSDSTPGVRGECRIDFPEEGWIQFDLVPEPDWEAAARSSLSEIDLDAPDPAAVKAMGDYLWGSVEIEFPVEVPAALREPSRYLLTPEGATQLAIGELVGVARFNFDRRGEAIHSTLYYG